MGGDDTTRPPKGPWDPELAITATISAERQDAPSPARSRAIAPEAARYSVERELARGGLGRILEGFDHRLGRTVAIKELLVKDPSLEQRFAREALITARLQHPSIVTVYDLGAWASGDPYYAMQLVPGRSLGEVIAETRTLAERLALLPNVLAVAEAMAYAHNESVIHRDLKPANVLVGSFGETVVVDWGLAKILGQGDEEVRGGHAAAPELDSDLTALGSVVGTPAYMPPEQALGRPLDARADVYAIGAILRQVLTGETPVGGAGQVLDRAVPRELHTIVAKAMAPDREARYPTARQLADDLRRFQTGQLVMAHRYSLRALLLRWLRRYRLTVGVATALLGVLAVVAVTSVQRIVREKDEATRQRERAEERANELRLTQAHAVLVTDPTASVAWLKAHHIVPDTLDRARSLALEATSRGVAHAVLAGEHRISALLPLPDGTIVTGDMEGDLVRWEVAGARRHRIASYPTSVEFLGLAGQSVVGAGADGIVRVQSLDGGPPRALGGPAETLTDFVVLDGGRLATAALSGEVRVWDLVRGDGQARVVHGGPVVALAASRDGRMLASAGRDGVKVYPVAGGEPRVLADVHGEALAFAGSDLVLADETNAVWLYPADGSPRRALGSAGQGIPRLVTSPDGTRVAGDGAVDGTLWVWSPAGREVRTLRGELALSRIAWSPDGRWLCTAGTDGTSRLWSPDSVDVRALRGHTGALTACAFAAHGRELITAGVDGAVRVWEVPDERVRPLVGDGTRLMQLVFARDGQALAGVSEGGSVLVWDPGTGARRLSERRTGIVPCAAFSPDGRILASGGYDGIVAVRSRDGGAVRELSKHEGMVTSLAFSPDGATLASGGRDGTVRLWDLATGRGRVVATESSWIMRLAFAPDGRRLAAASEALLLVDTATGQARRLEGHRGQVFRVAFSGDGRWLASGSEDRTARLWDLAAGTSRELGGYGDTVFDVAFSPDSRLLATSSFDHAVRIWDTVGGRVRELAGHGDRVFDVAFSPDGKTLASASKDGTVRVWEVEGTGARVLRHAQAMTRVAFSPDGRVLATAGEDGVVRLWTETAAPALADAAAVARFLDEATTAVVVGPNERPATPLH